MSELSGKWVQVEGQPYEGLWFKFKEDGTFEAQYEPMGIVSSGTFETAGSEITMEQTSHTLGMVGEFKGLFAVDEDTLKMSLTSAPGGERPNDLAEARIYQKE